MSTDNPWFTITKLQELKNKIPMMHNAHRGLRGDKTTKCDIPTTTLTLHHIVASDKTISSSDTRVKLVQGWQCLIVPDRVVSLSIYLTVYDAKTWLCVLSWVIFQNFYLYFHSNLDHLCSNSIFQSFFSPQDIGNSLVEELKFVSWWFYTISIQYI